MIIEFIMHCAWNNILTTEIRKTIGRTVGAQRQHLKSVHTATCSGPNSTGVKSALKNISENGLSGFSTSSLPKVRTCKKSAFGFFLCLMYWYE